MTYALASWHHNHHLLASAIMCCSQHHILPGPPPFPGKPFLNIFQHRVDGLRVDGWCQPHCGAGGPSPPPHARRPPGAGIAFGRDVAEEESALMMARTLTGGVGCVARWPTRRQVASALRRVRPLVPPPCSSSPWRHDCVRSCCHCGGVCVDVPRVDGWCRLRCSMAHASTGGIGVAAWASRQAPRLRSVVAVAEEDSASMSARFWLFSVALLDCTRVDKWHRHCGAGVPSLPPPPPSAHRRPPGIAIADEW